MLQQKLAAIIHELQGGGEGEAAAETNGVNGYGGGGAESPLGVNGGTAWGGEGPAEGYTTPYDGGGGAANGAGASWGGAGQGGATPYGATPYGQGNGWN